MSERTERIYDNITDLIGNTPLVRIRNVVPEGAAEVLAKLESFNPLSSVKDRIAISMVREAEKAGEIGPGSTIIEATSGNTGIGLAFVAAALGYRCVLVLPDTFSIERRKLLQALGAELILTPGPMGIKEAQRVAGEYAEKTPGAWLSRQFDNPANVKIHRETTAREILRDTGGRVDAVVAGVGTGGTVTGVGQILKQELGTNVQIVAVEPIESQVLKGGTHSPHKLQGIGAGMIPAIYDASVVDRVVDVSSDDAFKTSRRLAKEEGIFVGISSGAIAWAAFQVAKDLGPGKRVVVVLPDTGERYLSTALFEYTDLVNQPATTPQMLAERAGATAQAP
ncbi:MAG: cysteine synthase A [Acidobacteria bacterium]|nr:cysteine synthase A [Acidobacteriota bacterium]MBV9477313.1 cysteine synthase A [Acidobacteriota bacterium]